MKIIRYLLIAGLLIYFSGHFFSCQKDEDYRYFLVQVDSVYISEPVRANQSFEVEFFGYIGHNGCYSFHEFIWEKQGQNIFVETWGKVSLKSTICSDVLVYLNGEKLKFLFEQPGSYKLSIKQPDGTFLEQQFQVE